MKIQNKHTLKISLLDSENNDVTVRMLNINDCESDSILSDIIKNMYKELSNIEKNKLLPDGCYHAYQSGYEISVEYLGETYAFKTDYGIRGFNVPITVEVHEGEIIKAKMNHG